MTVRLGDDELAVITEILNRGNKVVLQRKGDGILILEEKRKIKYSNATPTGER